MLLGTLYEQISRAVRRGSSLDSVIPDWVESATRTLEMNHTFNYMKTLTQIVTNPLAEDRSRIDLGDFLTKTVIFLRVRTVGAMVGDEGYFYLAKVGAEDVLAMHASDVRVPSGFWVDSNRYIVLDTYPDVALPLDLYSARYTNWSGDEADEPPLAGLYHPLLKAQAIIEGATDIKDPGLIQLWTVRRDEALKMAIGAEEAATYEGREYVMNMP